MLSKEQFAKAIAASTAVFNRYPNKVANIAWFLFSYADTYLLPETLAAVYWKEVGERSGVSLSDVKLTSAEDLKNVCDFVARHADSDLFEEFDVIRGIDGHDRLSIEDLAAVKFRGQVEHGADDCERFPLFNFDITQYDPAEQSLSV